jgi:vacuolar-type H+-ATPase subunit D/Vma8
LPRSVTSWHGIAATREARQTRRSLGLDDSHRRNVFEKGHDTMKERIDAIIMAFVPEMERITRLDESRSANVKIARNWLRCQVEQFAEDIRESYQTEI